MLQIAGNKAGIWLGKRNLVKYAIIRVWESFGCFCTYCIKTFIANAFDYPRHLFGVKFKFASAQHFGIFRKNLVIMQRDELPLKEGDQNPPRRRIRILRP